MNLLAHNPTAVKHLHHNQDLNLGTLTQTSQAAAATLQFLIDWSRSKIEQHKDMVDFAAFPPNMEQILANSFLPTQLPFTSHQPRQHVQAAAAPILEDPTYSNYLSIPKTNIPSLPKSTQSNDIMHHLTPPSTPKPPAHSDISSSPQSAEFRNEREQLSSVKALDIDDLLREDFMDDPASSSPTSLATSAQSFASPFSYTDNSGHTSTPGFDFLHLPFMDPSPYSTESITSTPSSMLAPFPFPYDKALEVESPLPYPSNNNDQAPYTADAVSALLSLLDMLPHVVDSVPTQSDKSPRRSTSPLYTQAAGGGFSKKSSKKTLDKHLSSLQHTRLVLKSAATAEDESGCVFVGNIRKATDNVNEKLKDLESALSTYMQLVGDQSPR
ncbi:hypothetical protein BJ742DRAFT_793740 [Cladochytrium replicatum]|nr:hypothetical protein BJ742DRAFT_793740 [Cladochytrium replicatum]